MMLAIAANAVAAAESVAYRFGVFYDGKRIGEHTFEVLRDTDATRVESRAEFGVKLLFVRVYRYRHKANELWRDGCLADLASTTDDNGEYFEIRATREGGALRIDRREPPREPAVFDGGCAATYPYWDLERLRRPKLINPQDGEVTPASLVHEGVETRHGTAADRYLLSPQGLASITLWYRRGDGEWMGLETRRDDSTLEYRLEDLSRQPAGPVDGQSAVPVPTI